LKNKLSEVKEKDKRIKSSENTSEKRALNDSPNKSFKTSGISLTQSKY